MDHPVLAKQAGDIVATVRRHVAVVGQLADADQLLDGRRLGRRKIGHPDFAGMIAGNQFFQAKNYVGSIACNCLTGA